MKIVQDTDHKSSLVYSSSRRYMGLDEYITVRTCAQNLTDLPTPFPTADKYEGIQECFRNVERIHRPSVKKGHAASQ